jgi:hypothetical protein
MMKQYTDAEVAIWNEAVAACEAAMHAAIDLKARRLRIDISPFSHYLVRTVASMRKRTVDQIRADKIERIIKIMEE